MSDDPGWVRAPYGDQQAQLWKARAEKAEAEVERLKKQCEGLAQAALNNGQDLLLHEYKVTRLREALEPFAEYADRRQKIPANLQITHGSNMAKRQLTMGDCYTAAEALAGVGGE